MRENLEDPRPAAGTTMGTPTRLWATAAAVAGLGSWVLYDALPGINWVLWTGAAVAGLLVLARRRGHPLRPTLVMGGAAVVIAGAAAMTASEVMSVLICAAIVVCLAMQMLLTGSASLRPITARFTALAPLVALRAAAVQAMRRAVEATSLIRSTRAREWVRGIAITVPVLIGFALLLAGADPVFAGWRDAVARLVASWEFVPRLVFFGALLVVVLGAYGHASTEPSRAPTPEGTVPARWLGSTERLMLLAGVAALFWLFLAVQLGYLFGNLARVAASGVTFAEYARRGFAELSIVASASALLIVVSERYGNTDGRERPLRFLTFAVIAAVLLLLGSAFRRVWLYEAAYGYTTARLYAQVYMCAVAAGLVVLALEIARALDAGRLFRRAATAATLLFIALAYWNHEAWIARRNIDRFASTGRLDVAYLARELSPDAVPAIAERLPSLPEPARSELRRAVRERYVARTDLRQGAWFEWNLARSEARRALAASF
jgi:two-component system sensor histidine kinase BaeS